MWADATRAEAFRLIHSRTTWFWSVVFLPILTLVFGVLAAWVMKSNMERLAADTDAPPELKAMLVSGPMNLGESLLQSAGNLAGPGLLLFTLIGAATVYAGDYLQDVLRSIVAGFYLLGERPFGLGERISVKDADGEVDSINLRTTTLSGADGTRFHVPNSTIFGEIVTNRASRDGEPMLVTVSSLPLGNADLAGEIARAIASAPGVRSPVRIDRYALEDEVLSFTAYVVLDSGRNAGSAVIERLRQRFPGASVVIERRKA